MSRLQQPKNFTQARNVAQQHIPGVMGVILSIIYDRKARHADRLVAATIVTNLAFGKPRQMDPKSAEEVSPETRAKREEDRRAILELAKQLEAQKLEQLALENR